MIPRCIATTVDFLEIATVYSMNCRVLWQTTAPPSATLDNNHPMAKGLLGMMMQTAGKGSKVGEEIMKRQTNGYQLKAGQGIFDVNIDILSVEVTG